MMEGLPPGAATVSVDIMVVSSRPENAILRGEFGIYSTGYTATTNYVESFYLL
jgi:hypothetical protein